MSNNKEDNTPRFTGIMECEFCKEEISFFPYAVINIHEMISEYERPSKNIILCQSCKDKIEMFLKEITRDE